MLGKMSEQNRVSGSKLLQATLKSLKLGSSYAMTLLQLSFAEDDPEECLTAPTKALDENACRWRCEAAEGRLRSRCCGLIEVSRAVHSFELGPGGQSVGFLHRSVVEFLETSTDWEKLRILTSNTTFDAEIALMSSSVAELKAMPVRSLGSPARPCALARMARMLGYEKSLSDAGRVTFHDKYLPRMRGRAWPPLARQRVIQLANRGDEGRQCFMGQGLQANAALLPTRDSPLALPPACRRSDYTAIREDLFPMGDVEHVFERCAAHLVLHFVEETHEKLRIAISSMISQLSVNRTKSITFTDPGRESTKLTALWTKRWKNSIKSSWSLFEFTIQHCFSILDGTEDGGFDFSNEAMVRSLLHVLDNMTPGKATKPIVVVARSRHKICREIWYLPSAWVVILVLHKSWRTISGLPGIELDEIAGLSSRIEDRILGPGFINRPYRVRKLWPTQRLPLQEETHQFKSKSEQRFRFPTKPSPVFKPSHVFKLPEREAPSPWTLHIAKRQTEQSPDQQPQLVEQLANPVD